ncbi:MAG: glutamine--fructose-6-phosphate transaminase (isomerizing) [Coriobacteriales bacterium]|jgi:glucosamine--fructose-6-phosphate aminotransferase (isomerizing)|nr:glutamine--fructose-6-phosphate transaminase (isomerizing) [Coriobacteriales bacterium]
MCGIVAFTGTSSTVPVLLNGLRRLEYRGYDSAGLALQTRDGSLEILKRAGKVAELEQALEEAEDARPAENSGAQPADQSTSQPARCGRHTQGVTRNTIAEATTGIGHTRWATHGVPSEDNAHPQLDCSGSIAVVHNGIIENYAALRAELLERGHRFISQTDTEVVAHLIEEEYAAAHGDLVLAVRTTVARLSGSFALAVCHADEPGMLVVTRCDSPLVVGRTKNGAIAASDTPALIEYTREVYYLDDRDLAVLRENGSLQFFDPAGSAIFPTPVTIEWTLEDAERGGYPDFMLKEIHEQPRVIRDTIAGRYNADTRRISFDDVALSPRELKQIERVIIVACGTSYHAGLIGRDLMETWARVPVETAVASEFRYRNPLVTPATLVIAISQSGETADTLEAVKLARLAGAHVLAITNVVGSRITMEANTVLYIKAHLEIAVAATKSFLAQVALLTLFALYLSQERGQLESNVVSEIYAAMEQLPRQIDGILEDTGSIISCASECGDAQTALFIGRGVGATICYEGALKLKEISYVHAEAFSAGEIKHGPIALIDPEGLTDPRAQTPVVAMVCKSVTYDKMLSNIEEVLARGAKVIAVATAGDTRIAELTPHVISIPEVPECLSPLVASVPLQLFARHIALLHGANVDQPRNLAKSVTVE